MRVRWGDRGRGRELCEAVKRSMRLMCIGLEMG